MIRRALLAGMLALGMAVAVGAAPALAAPFISIESPSSGTVTNHKRPVFSGFTTDTEDPVTLAVSKGGSLVESAQATPSPGGEWSVQLPSELEDGKYSAVAEQT